MFSPDIAADLVRIKYGSVRFGALWARQSAILSDSSGGFLALLARALFTMVFLAIVCLSGTVLAAWRFRLTQSIFFRFSIAGNILIFSLPCPRLSFLVFTGCQTE
ncbi:hypothetical protein [Sphingorhabdus sp. YGSMI21]|uniref:hypothetical protein n=1 Tax=Sphingorhabdus sp. YGSMI21 TaxID=2077182 RepID=UPI0013DD66AA|nr:hypothetical protein [Sphingorhabdus sp. YGSMI21]